MREVAFEIHPIPVNELDFDRLARQLDGLETSTMLEIALSSNPTYGALRLVGALACQGMEWAAALEWVERLTVDLFDVRNDGEEP